ncbi:MAG: DUF4426 domain-containing protein [Pseudomonadota bacterium]
MRLLTALFILLTSSAAVAENSTRIDGYTVHHNIITTDFLSEDVARSYGIIRSKNRAMLNVSVIKEKEGTTGTPVTADVKASSTNIYGQQRGLNLREIHEADAIYYIGTFLVRNRETLNFHLDVKPEGESNYSPAAFSEEFFIE